MKRSAFTLIELIVVITILMLLAGIVFAAFAPVREKSRETVCISNLKQIGTAIAMYQHDYDGIEADVGSKLEFWQLGLPRTVIELEPYLKNKQVFFCPSNTFQLVPGRQLTTYWWLISSDDGPGPKFSDDVARRGAEYPIVVCKDHGTPYNFNTGDMDRPRWETRLAIVLRLNKQVKALRVPIRAFTREY